MGVAYAHRRGQIAVFSDGRGAAVRVAVICPFQFHLWVLLSLSRGAGEFRVASPVVDVGRLWRQGQQAETVTIYHIITRGTIDERVMDALASKDATQTALINAVKAELMEG